MANKKKICPIMSIGFGTENCIKEKCAWWSKFHEACALQTINEIPRKLFNIITKLSKGE